MSDGGFTISGTPALQRAEIHRLVGSLSLMAGGFRSSHGSPILQARKWTGSDKRTAKGALEDLVLWFVAQGGTLDAQWRTVERALGADRTAKLRRKSERKREEWLKEQEKTALEKITDDVLDKLGK